jgi:hypothetical protein
MTHKQVPERRHDERRDDEFYRIRRDIENGKPGSKFLSLRKKLQDVLPVFGEKSKSRSVNGEVLDLSYEDEHLGYSQMVKDDILPGKMDPQFSKWKNGTASWPFEVRHALALLDRIWTHSFWSTSEYRRRLEEGRVDGYFDALVRQMQCERATEKSVAGTAPGVYQVWRPSIVMPGRYVLGLFAVYRVRHSDTDAERPIKTIEIHRLHGAPIVDAGGSGQGGLEEPSPLIAAPELEEIYLGYMVKKSRQIIVHSFDALTHAFHFTVITNTYRGGLDSGGSLAVLAGVSTGIIGQQTFYTLPVVMLRDEEASKAVFDISADTVVKEAYVKQEQQARDFARQPVHERPPVSPVEQVMLSALKRLPAYKRLNLVDSEQVPEFVRMQIQNMAPNVSMPSPSAVSD